MNKIDFSNTESGRRILNIETDALEKFDLLMDRKDEEALRRFWSLLTNIKGNLNSLYTKEGTNFNWTRKANKEQLNDNLYKLYVIASKTDTWFDDCKFLIKENYDWSRIANQMKANFEHNSKKGVDGSIYIDSYSKLWTFCDYTDEEIIVMVSNDPYLSKLYTGDNEVIKNLGVILI